MRSCRGNAEENECMEMAGFFFPYPHPFFAHLPILTFLPSRIRQIFERSYLEHVNYY